MSCLQGPHQGAQKSISTGWRFDSSITSFMKPWVVVSLMRPSGAAAAAPRRSPASSCVPRLASGGPDCPGQHCSPIKWAGEPANAIGFRRPAAAPATGTIRGGWPVASRNFTRSSRRDRGGHGVDQRMRVDDGVLISAASSTTVTRPARSLMAPNGVTAPGVDAERLPHQVGRAEREAAAGAEPPVQRFQLDRGVLQRGHQEQRVLLVLEEQVLGVAAGDRAAQRLATARP